jgi:hypothetical protein
MSPSRIRRGLASLLLAGMSVGCGSSSKATPESPVVYDAGVMLECPSGFSLGSTVQVTYDNVVSSVGCWQATIGSTHLLSVAGLPDVELGPLQMTLLFNPTDASGAPCSYSSGQTIPLTSTCIEVEGSNLMQWFTYSNVANYGLLATGSILLNQWASASGQSVSVSFSEDAQLVLHAQSGTNELMPIVGSFETAAK